MTEEIIASLEASLAHHEQQIQDLSDMVNQQWKEIDRLKSALIKANDKIEEIQNSGDKSSDKPMSVSEMAAAEKPPHY